MSNIRAVLFDLDGTLLDTAPDLVAALNHVRGLEGFPEAAVAKYREFVSQGALGLLRAGMPGTDDAHMERRRQHFLDYYGKHSLVGTMAFDGVEELLGTLESQGLPWGIVTNKPEYLTHPVLKGFEWNVRAACVVCGDTLPRAKPFPDPVLLACERLGVEPETALMVGDDPRDLDAAEAAGAQPVLAAYGYGAEHVFATDRKLVHVAQTPQDVLAMAGILA